MGRYHLPIFSLPLLIIFYNILVTRSINNIFLSFPHTMFQISGFSMLKTTVLLGMLLSVTATGAPPLRRGAADGQVDRLLQTLYEETGSKPSMHRLIDALKEEGVKLGMGQAFNAVNKFKPARAQKARPSRRQTQPIPRAKLTEVLQALYEKNESMPQAGELIHALKAVDEGLEINIIEATKVVNRFTPKPLPMPPISTGNNNAIKEEIMYQRAEILAEHPEYDTWKEYQKYHHH